MNKLNILDKCLFEWAELLNNGEVTSFQLVQTCLDRVSEFDKEIKSFTKVFAERAISESIEADKRRGKGSQLSAIDGIPFAVKENIEIKGEVAAAGVKARKGVVSSRDSKVIKLLKSAGAIGLGHLNMHEAALGSTNDNPLYGKTYNPHKKNFTPGGSSGGSAAAVAAGFCLFSLGTDTLGSIRIPASYCGVLGIKPSKGLVSLDGVVPLSSRFDTVGPLARSSYDLSLILECIAKYDPMCPNAQSSIHTMSKDLKVQKTVIGFLENFNSQNLDHEIETKYNECIDQFRSIGFEMLPIDCSDINFGKARREALKIIETEAYFFYKEEFEKNPTMLSEKLNSFIEYGSKLKSIDIIKAEHYINTLKVKCNLLYEKVDLIISPTTFQKAFEFGNSDDTQADLTCLANLIKSPAVSIPVGFSSDDLPIGVQLMGKEFEDYKILKIARFFEEQNFLNMRPKNF